MFLTLLNTFDSGRKKVGSTGLKQSLDAGTHVRVCLSKELCSRQCSVRLCLVVPRIICVAFFKGRRRFYGGHRRPYFSENRHLDEPGEPLEGRKTVWLKTVTSMNQVHL